MPRVNDLPTVGVTAGYPTSFATTDEVVSLQSGVVVKGAMSLLPFAQSGTGAATETVQTALRRLPHSAQYDTAAHFNTVRAALTGTQGISPQVQFANFDATATTPGALIYGGATFNGTYDPVLYYGYNISGQSGSTRVDTSEPSLKVGLEGHYWNLTSHLMEWNWDYVSSDGLTTRRPGGFTVNRTSHAVDWDLAGPTFDLWKTDVGVGASFGIDLTSGDSTTVAKLKIQGGSGEILALGLATAGAITDVDFGFGSITASGGWLSTDSNSVDFMINAATVATITSGGAAISFSNNGGNVNFTTQNTSNTSGSNARHFIDVAGSSSGDPYTEYHVSGVSGTCVGIDTSDTYKFKISVDAAAIGDNDFVIDLNSNVGVGTATFGTNAVGAFAIKTGTAPSAGVADCVHFYSSDNSAGNTIPSFYCEGTEVIATGQADSASSVRVKMRINGTVVTLLAI